MALVLTSGPAVEPVTLAEAKAHLRLDGTAEDTLVGSLIVTSRLHVEAALGLALITQGWSYFIDDWPPGRELVLPLRPVQSITAVRLYAADESLQTLASDTYLLDGAGTPARLVRRGNLAWPKPSRAANGIEIAFVAGHGNAAANVPAPKLGTRFGTALSSAFVDVALRGRGLSDVLRTLALRLSEIALKAAFKPLTDALGGALAGAFTPVAFAKGGVVGGPMPVPFAQGGVIASPIAFPLDGNRTGLAGERGPEAILPLARGPDGSLGVRAGAGGGLNVTFNVTTPDAESFRRSETQIAALLARAVGQGQRNL